MTSVGTTDSAHLPHRASEPPWPVVGFTVGHDAGLPNCGEESGRGGTGPGSDLDRGLDLLLQPGDHVRAVPRHHRLGRGLGVHRTPVRSGRASPARSVRSSTHLRRVTVNLAPRRSGSFSTPNPAYTPDRTLGTRRTNFLSAVPTSQYSRTDVGISDISLTRDSIDARVRLRSVASSRRSRSAVPAGVEMN